MPFRQMGWFFSTLVRTESGSDRGSLSCYFVHPVHLSVSVCYLGHTEVDSV